MLTPSELDAAEPLREKRNKHILYRLIDFLFKNTCNHKFHREHDWIVKFPLPESNLCC